MARNNRTKSAPVTSRPSDHSASRKRKMIDKPSSLTRHEVARSGTRSEEHTSELQSLMRISYAVFCLKKKKKKIYEQEDRVRHGLYRSNMDTKHTSKNTRKKHR